MEYVTGTIQRDVMTEPSVTLAAWEVPVLEAAVGYDLVEVARFEEERDVEPAAEYARLERGYGVDPRSGVSYVERVYGQFTSGKFQAALRAAGALADDEAIDDEAMSREQLMAILDARRIDYPKKVTTKRLLELYRAIEHDDEA